MKIYIVGKLWIVCWNAIVWVSFGGFDWLAAELFVEGVLIVKSFRSIPLFMILHKPIYALIEWKMKIHVLVFY